MDQAVLLYLTSSRENNIEKLKSMVEAGMPVATSNAFGQSALHIAALCGNIEAVTYLLGAGCPTNLTNQVLGTPLHYAASAQKNALEVCKLLLDAGADPHAVDQQGGEPFERASNEEVRRLLGGPDSRIFDCCAAGDVEGLKKLLESGEVTSLFVYDMEGDTPLSIAIRANSQELVKAILAFNADCVKYPDRSGNSPLHVAVEEGNADMIKLILSFGPNIDLPNMKDSEYADGSWRLGGEDLEPFDKTALHLAVEAGDVDIAKLLIDAGASLNELDFDRAAPLHLALEMQDQDMIDLLLEKGADVSIPHPDFSSPLHLAAYQGPVSTLEKLIKSGANVNAASAGDEGTPLMYAARAGKLPKVEALLAAGADVKAVNGQGDSALHLAAVNGHKGVIDALIAKGADVKLRNKAGNTPIDIAKNSEIKELLAK